MPRVTICTVVIVIEDDGEDSPAPVEVPKPEPWSMHQALEQLFDNFRVEMRHGRDCSPFSTRN